MSFEELDEHERSEAVREWVRKNISSIAIGVLVGIGAIYGYERYEHHRERTAGLAGDDYRAYSEAFEKDDKSAAETLGKAVRDKYPGSPYATMVTFKEAAKAIEANDRDAAISSLQWAAEHSDVDEIRDLAKVRLGRVLIDAGKADEALTAVADVKSEGFKAVVAEVRGDALRLKKQVIEAKAAYDEALLAFDSGDARRQFVEMKRDDLMVASAPAATAAPAEANPKTGG